MSPVRVIGEKGENLGTLETSEALKLAQEQGLDLIEIAPTAKPPVCRIMDFGKFRYEREKGERERSKNQKESELKIIKIGFTTGKHDLELRAGQAKKFLEKGDKVKINMNLRGREKAHGQVAMQKFNEFLKMVPMEYNLESPPKRFPQGITTVITKSTVK